MPASIAGLRGERDGSDCLDIDCYRTACKRAALPCAGGVCGSKGKSFPWLPTGRQGLAAADQDKASEALLVFIGRCRIMTRERI